MGHLLKVVVHPANLQDRDGAKLLLGNVKQQFPGLSHLWLDQAYNGAPFETWLKAEVGCTLTIPQHPAAKNWLKDGEERETKPTFKVLPRRWVVERTFAWCGRNRRLSKDYEGLPTSEEAFIYLGMGALMARRLASA